MGRLAERERTARPRDKGPDCDIRRALAGLDDQDDADALRRLVFERRDLSSNDVSNLLVEEGIEISPATIGRHRRNVCARCRKG